MIEGKVFVDLAWICPHPPAARLSDLTGYELLAARQYVQPAETFWNIR